MSGSFDDPFGGAFDLGRLQGLLGNVTQRMEQMKAEAAAAVVQGQAGGGLVAVEANGSFEILSVRIDPQALADRELLEDLVTAAVNDALGRARARLADGVSAMTGDLGLPPGLL